MKSTKLVRVWGLAKLMAEENCSFLGINCIGVDSEFEQVEEETAERGYNHSLDENLASCEMYYGIAHFLLKLEVHPGLISSQARTIKLRVAKFCINKNLLYWRDPSRILLRCLDKE